MIINKQKIIPWVALIALSILLVNRCAVKNTSTTSESPLDSNKTEPPKEKKENYFDEDEILFTNKVYQKNIRTVRLYKKDWELGDPVIQLGTGEQLEMHWDVLDGSFTNYQYRIIHCTKDWEKSNLNEMEYLDGFNDNYVNYAKNSFNTQQNYTHYAISFPNDQISFRKSGNYIIIVYPENSADHPVITRRFYVTENSISLKPQVKYPSDVDERYYRQEVDFDIFFDPQEIVNPYSNIHVEITQNNRQDYICKGLEPNFVKENQMIYNYDDVNVFEGGNEYRHLDLTNHQNKTAHIRQFDFRDDTIHGIMLNDVRRQFKKYMQYEDINGRYIVKTLSGADYLLESNYIMVHFTLPYDSPVYGGDIYLMGEFSDYEIRSEFKMVYDTPSKSYIGKVYLKQGYYNYNYLFVPDSGRPNVETVEGTHFDTENQYQFKVYYSDPQNFYDRLLLYQTSSSRDNF